MLEEAFSHTVNFNNAFWTQEFEDQLDTLSDGLTLREDVSELARNNVTFPKTQDFREIVRTQQRVRMEDEDESLKIFSNFFFVISSF